MVDIHFIVLLKLPSKVHSIRRFVLLARSFALGFERFSLAPRGEFSAKLSLSGRDGSWIFGGVKINRVKVKQ